ncbi:flagellar hook-basal body complex protein [Desulfovibrio sp. OttesenSCG-928-O18]|nr:flagellar hook-basal body complex protein [Desulfovibrio sp. OttesenSCG-928-O18]
MMSGLYSGATGLKSHSTGMSVISNNVANVSTVAYKQSSVLYSDLISQYMTGSASPDVTLSQLGAGAAVGSVRTIFTQGGFEAGNSATDLGINGIGFFAVNNGATTEYTRAGNFSFLSTGELVDSSGWNLMGYGIANGSKSSTLSPVIIDTSSSGAGKMAGKATTSITSCSQLGGLTDTCADAANPFFAMASAYDGTASSPLANAYSYSQGIQFYDNNGNLQNATVYYDLAGKENGQTAVEYVVALDDASLDGSSLAGTKAAGLLMAGTLTFSSAGELQNITAFTPPSSGDPTDLTSWTPAAVVNGSPAFTVTVAGSGTQSIGLDMGLSLTGTAASGPASAAAASADPSSIYAVNTSAKRNSTASSAYGESTGVIAQTMNGYAEGYLQDITISTDGTITGKYSNGQNEDLFQIPLYRFTSEDGLKHTGGNRYAATAESGAAQEGVAGTENFGTINECTLEQSNVDLSTEFSSMIVTQRGFQMNSKVVTTYDQLLQKALELKR